MLKNKLLVIAAATALALFGVASPAQAEQTPLHPDVEYALSAVPGGIIIDEHTVIWPELEMQLSVVPEWTRAVGTCATGQYCAYSKSNRGGTKLSWTSCTTVSTAALASVGSIANARSSGTVQARSSAGTVLATASAGGSVNVFGAVSTLRCIS